MAESVQNSPEVLCAEILADARRESAEIMSRAQAEAASLLAAAKAEAEKIRRERREQAQAEAARRRETILATVAVEVGRLRAERIEMLLESVRQEICCRLQTHEFDRRETAIALAAEAIRQMRGNDFLVKISATDHAAFGNDLPGEIARLVGRSPLNLVISADTTVTDGVIIQSADGLEIWDNRLSARLERLWPELRRQIALNAALVVEAKEISGRPNGVYDARQRLGVRQPSAALTSRAGGGKAAEDCRSPKPGGGSEAPEKGNP